MAPRLLAFAAALVAGTAPIIGHAADDCLNRPQPCELRPRPNFSFQVQVLGPKTSGLDMAVIHGWADYVMPADNPVNTKIYLQLERAIIGKEPGSQQCTLFDFPSRENLKYPTQAAQPGQPPPTDRYFDNKAYPAETANPGANYFPPGAFTLVIEFTTVKADLAEPGTIAGGRGRYICWVQLLR